MNNSWILALQLSFIGLAPSAFPQALEETTALLNDGAARDQLGHSDPKAAAAMQQVKDLGLDAAGEAKVYDLSSKILEKLSASAGGDSNKMNDQVQTLLRDPSSLESIISADQKSEIHDLAHQIEYKKAQ